MVFSYTSSTGVVVDKVFMLDASSYAIGLDVKIENKSSTALQGALELSLVQKWTEEDKPKQRMVLPGLQPISMSLSKRLRLMTL